MKNIKKHKNDKKDSLSKKILTYLGETSKNLLDLGSRIVFDINGLIREEGFSLYYSPSNFKKTVSYLKKTPYFNYKNNKFYLTPLGRVKIIKMILKEKNKKKTKWDGKWRAVIFDIPEIKRKDRRFLRKELKWIGFKEVQKSVWVFPYNIEQELKVLLRLWRIDFKGDIRFILIEKMNDADLRKYFGL